VRGPAVPALSPPQLSPGHAPGLLLRPGRDRFLDRGFGQPVPSARKWWKLAGRQLSTENSLQAVDFSVAELRRNTESASPAGRAKASRLGSADRVTPGVDLIIADGAGNPLPTGQTGEIGLRCLGSRGGRLPDHNLAGRIPDEGLFVPRRIILSAEAGPDAERCPICGNVQSSEPERK